MSTTQTGVTGKALFDALVIVAWIVGVAMVGLALGFKALWAPFFCAILFTVHQKSVAHIPQIIAGGVTGVWLAYGIIVSIGALTPVLGHLASTGIVLFCGIYLIFCGGLLLPLFINLSAFVFLAVTLSLHITEPPIESTLLLVVGGGILLGGEVLLLKLLAARTAKADATSIDPSI